MTQKNENTNLATTQSQELAKPATVGRGFENVDVTEISMPRAKLLQSNSPEVSDRDYDFRAGDIVHSLLMEKLPQKFVPLSIWGSNILFVPREDGAKIGLRDKLGLTDEDMSGTVLCRAGDGTHGDRYGSCADCGKCKFQGNEKPICTPTINVLIAPISDEGTVEMPVVIQFASTSYKHGRKFRDTAFYSSFGGDLFDRMYKLDAFEAASNGNRWYEMRVKAAGLVPPELKPQISAMYEGFAGKAIVVEDDRETEASNSNASSDIDY